MNLHMKTAIVLVEDVHIPPDYLLLVIISSARAQMAGVLLYCLSAKYHALFSSIFRFSFYL